MKPNTLYVCVVQRYENYTDYEFDDGDPCTLWTVTHDAEDNTWYGTRRTSETPYAPFEDDYTEMSAEDVTFCRSLIPDVDLPEVNTNVV